MAMFVRMMMCVRKTAGGVAVIVYRVKPNVNRCALLLSLCGRRAVAPSLEATESWEYSAWDMVFPCPCEEHQAGHLPSQRSPAPSAEPRSAESSSRLAEPGVEKEKHSCW